MSGLTLCIGSKNLSSWSLRPWLLMQHHELPFKELLIALDQPDTRKRILERSPSGRVPVLLHGRLRVWESLAICEYVAETFALPGAWPMDPEARAFARAVAHEMHGGFADLRRELPFDATRAPATKDISAAARGDIDRVCAIWREARSRFGWQGEWLFGHFGIADAMFAPVALRFSAYDVKLERTERDYVDAVLAHPAVQLWCEGAAHEASARRARPPAVAASTATAPTPAERTARDLEVDAAPIPPSAPTAPAAMPAPVPTEIAAAQAPTPPAGAAPTEAEDEISDDELPPSWSNKPVAPEKPARAGAGNKGAAKESGTATTPVRSIILPPD